MIALSVLLCRWLVQICHEFTRFSTYMPAVKVANFFGGIDIKKNRDELKKTPPQVVVGTPGRIKQVRMAVLGPPECAHDKPSGCTTPYARMVANNLTHRHPALPCQSPAATAVC